MAEKHYARRPTDWRSARWAADAAALSKACGRKPLGRIDLHAHSLKLVNLRPRGTSSST